MLLIKIFHIRGGPMTREEIEKEWQLELKLFLDKHSKIMEKMTEEESNKYVKDNKINEKLQQLQKDFQEKYKHYL